MRKGVEGERGVEILPVGAAWTVTKATCRVFLTDLQDFLAGERFGKVGFRPAPFDCDYKLTGR